MPEELVILVDENDNPIGTEEKVKCHLPNGKLHRAFTALLFDIDGRLVLTKRAVMARGLGRNICKSSKGIRRICFIR